MGGRTGTFTGGGETRDAGCGTRFECRHGGGPQEPVPRSPRARGAKIWLSQNVRPSKQTGGCKSDQQEVATAGSGVQ